MAKHVTFLAIVDGVSKFWDCYAIDRADAIAMLREIYTVGAEIDVVLFCFR